MKYEIEYIAIRGRDKEFRIQESLNAFVLYSGNVTIEPKIH